MLENYGVHWFRRDLRVAGNPALRANWKRHEGRVLGVFCFDKDFLGRPDFSVNRFQFFIDSLESLQEELRAIGSDLLFLDIGPEKAFLELFTQLKKKPSLFSWNRDYEPFARKRDRKIKGLLQEHSIEMLTRRDHLLLEPNEIFKGGNPEDGYQVYSPFARKWLEIFQHPQLQGRVQEQAQGIHYLEKHSRGETQGLFKLQWKEVLKSPNFCSENLKIYSEKNNKRVTVSIPRAGSLASMERLEAFKKKLRTYGKDRDIPSLSGTSQFSLFLKNGSLNIGQIISFYKLQAYKKAESGAEKFLSELIWREFYYHILYRHPQVENQAFLEKYKNLQWENNKEWFERWKEGMTGFPIVDAGMRELKETGWMHNRVRMIVASFLTKDLLIDWKWGEKYFMDQLLDGDLAPNNGGWQWAASTGCDPQPYFRIFNPWLQSKKFDPEGAYIKRYIPELEAVPAKELHAPLKNPLEFPDYPLPLVDHSVQRQKALSLYKSASGKV